MTEACLDVPKTKTTVFTGGVPSANALAAIAGEFEDDSHLSNVRHERHATTPAGGQIPNFGSSHVLPHFNAASGQVVSQKERNGDSRNGSGFVG
jgi:hypothetical protein